MSVRAFELIGTVEVDTGKARSELNQFDSTLSRVNQKMQRSDVFGSLLKAGLATAGITSLTGELIRSGKAVLDYSAHLEQSKIAFTTLLGGADAATAHLKELQQFALKTPFEFEGLIDASRRLQAMGFAAKQVVPILTDVGNAVAAVGGSKEILDRVILALSQMQAKGRVATQEINQLAEAGIPAWRLLSEAIGKSRAETIKLAEQGQISSEVFLQAFQKFSQTNFGGMMEKQSHTFSGAMSNIKDSLSQTAATAFEPLFNKISQISDRISQEMQNGKPTFEKSLTAMLSGGTEIVAGIGEQIGETLINNIIEGIKNPRESIPRVLRNAFAVPIGIFNSVKNELLPEPSGNLTKPIPVPDLTPVPLPANTLSNQQSALDGTNKTAEKTADILERVKEKLFSVGDASTYAATKQALLRAGVTDLNSGLAAQALTLAAAGDAAQAFADKQQAETDRVFSRNQDIAAQLLEVAHRASEGVLDLGAAASGGRTELDKFNQGLALTAEVAGGFTDQINTAREALKNFVLAQAQAKKDQENLALNKMRAELSRTLTGMTREMGRGTDSTPLDELQQRLESLSDLKLQPGAFDSITNLFKQTPDAINFAQAMALVNTQLQGVAGDLGPAKLDEATKKIVALFRAASDQTQANARNDQLSRYKDLMVDLNQVMGAGVTVTQRQRIEQVLLTDTYKGLTDAQKENLKLRASEADAHLKRLKELDELRNQLSRMADDVTNIFSRAEEAFVKTPGSFANKWKEAFREVGLGFADMLAQMANDLLRSQVLKLLERVAGIDGSSGSESSKSNSSINPLGALTDKLLEKLGVIKPKATMPVSTSSTAGKADAADSQTKNTDRIVSGQETQTAQINAQMQKSADRIVEGLTPKQEGFWKGLLRATLSAAAGAAAGAATGGLLGGSSSGGATGGGGGSPASPGGGGSTVIVRDPSTGEIISGGGDTRPRRVGGHWQGGIINGPGSTTSDSILGIDPNGVPTAMVSRGEFVVNAEATRKNRAALELINETGKLPRRGLGGFLSWTSPISHKSVRDFTMPITHESFRNFAMPIMNDGFRNATMPALGYLNSGQTAAAATPGAPANLKASSSPTPETHNHYHFNVYAQGPDAAQSIQKSRRQLERQAAQTLGAAVRQQRAA